jgi:hypothetical protein
MPRLPVDGTKVIEHRITFGTLEREQISDLVNAIQAQKYTQAAENLANPIVDVLKDASALYAVATLIEMYTDIDFPLPTAGDASELWDAIKTGFENREETFLGLSEEEQAAFHLGTFTVASVLGRILRDLFSSGLGGQEFNAPDPWGGGVPGGGSGSRPVYTGQTPPI